METKTETPKNDIATFVQPELYVTTIEDLRIKIPKLNWKKELQLINIIQSVLQDVGPILGTPDASALGFITRMLEIAPDKATMFISIVMGKSTDWVEENLDIAEVIAVIVPLLRQRLDLIQAKLMPYIQGTNLPEGVAAVVPNLRP